MSPISDALKSTFRANTALLGTDGTILRVNAAWARFGNENALLLPASGVGTNYLELCEQSLGRDHRLTIDLRALLSGRLGIVSWVYPCHSPTRKQWFNLIAAPAPDGRPGAIVSHLDITDIAGERDWQTGPVLETSRAALAPIWIGPGEEQRNPLGAGPPAMDTSRLTPTQVNVLLHLRDNRSNRQIAEMMGISLATAKRHVAAVVSAVGTSRRELARR